ncbi:MAG: porin, partial [Pseudomonadales bacterium]|nr:porin [Pseudomonadales bacterium]
MNRPAMPFLLAFFSAQAATAQSYLPVDELQFYGRANVALHANDFENAAGGEQQDNWTLESHISVLGIRGGHTLQENLRAVFQLEYEVFVDDGNDGSDDNSEFRQRNSYLGLEGNWGRVIAGKHDTPLKLAQGKLDRFNDMLLGDLRAAIEGENRADNIVLYTSPLRDNWRFQAAFIPGEDSGTNPGDEDGLAVGVSASAEYSEGKQ